VTENTPNGTLVSSSAAAPASTTAPGSSNQNLQSRYEKLMNFSYTKQLDEIKDNLQRLEKTQSRKNINNIQKKVMFSEDVIINQ